MVSLRVILTAFLLGGICTLPPIGCWAEKGGVEAAIKIGVIGPFSGEDRQFGENGMLGVEIAIDYGEEMGSGVRVELIREDDQNDPDRAAAAIEKLVTKEGVSALIVLSGSSAMLAVTELADQYQTPIISTLSTHPDITKSEWVSQLTFDDDVQGTVAALFVMDELLIERVAVAWDGTDPHSAGLAEQFIRVYQEAGGRVISVDLSSIEDNDYDQVLDRFQQNDIDFIYLPVEVGRVISFEQASNKIHYHPQVMVSDGVLSLMILNYEADLNLLNNMLATDILTSKSPRTEFGRWAGKRFSSLSDESATTIAALGLEGMNALLTAVSQCGGSNAHKECINRGLRGGNEFLGVFGPFFINHQGKAQRPVFINRIMRGKLSFLLKVN